VASLLGADPLDVLFAGQTSIAPLLGAPVALALVLVLAKAVAYLVSLGCGFRGGLIFPAIFLGVGVADIAVQTIGMSPTAAVAIGTAAGMAAMSRTPVSSVLFAGLLVGGRRPGRDSGGRDRSRLGVAHRSRSGWRDRTCIRSADARALLNRGTDPSASPSIRIRRRQGSPG